MSQNRSQRIRCRPPRCVRRPALLIARNVAYRGGPPSARGLFRASRAILIRSCKNATVTQGPVSERHSVGVGEHGHGPKSKFGIKARGAGRSFHHRVGRAVSEESLQHQVVHRVAGAESAVAADDRRAGQGQVADRIQRLVHGVSS